jgi:FAD synthase
VVKGFGRGSRELGIPTANLPLESLGEHINALDCGVYYGWAKVDGAGPFKMVMSLGWNPYYGNKHKTVVSVQWPAPRSLRATNARLQEPHLLHDFPEDFYGSELRLVITGYLRPEKNFGSLGESRTALQRSGDWAAQMT